MSLADRSQKTSGIKILTQVGSDPDANRYTNLKKEEEKLRQAMRQKSAQSKPKRSRDTAANLGNAYREDHDSDDEGAISIAAIKSNYKKGANVPKQGINRSMIIINQVFQFFVISYSIILLNCVSGAAIYSSDEDESDFETRRSKKSDKSKVLRALADSDDESVGSNQNAGSDNETNDGSDSGSADSASRSGD